MNKTVVLTGHGGAVGTAIECALKNAGYEVIGIDKAATRQALEIQLDLSTINDRNVYERLAEKLEACLAGRQCVALINNAAVQHLGSLESLSIEEFVESQIVNVIAPLVLSKLLFPHLSAARGQIINIGSIHAKLTKPGFISYATSKGGLAGLTQALAVDIGAVVRVNCLAPAAIDTSMLREGFNQKPGLMKELENHHPTGTIASVEEIASVVLSILSGNYQFLNGAILDFSGGIGARLHDPV